MITNYELMDYCKNEGYSYADVVATMRAAGAKERLDRVKTFFSKAIEAFSKNSEKLTEQSNSAPVCCECCCC